MKLSTTLILVIVCAVLVAAVYFGRALPKSSDTARTVGEPFFPGFPLNDVTKIVLRDGAGTITLEHRSEGWVVNDYYGYPARFSAVADLIKQIYDLKVGQQVRAKPASLARLRLVDPADSAAVDAAATSAEFLLANGELAAALLIGSEKQGVPDPQAYGMARPEGQFVRLPAPLDSEKGGVFLVNQVFDCNVSPRYWIETQLFNVLNPDVAEITVTSPDGRSYCLVRPDTQAAIELAGIAPTQQLIASEANSVASGVSYFRVDDVLPPSVAETNTALDHAWTYRAKTFDGRVFTLSVSDTNIPTSYARVQVAYEEPADAAAATNATAEGKSPYAVRDEVLRLNERVSPWTYILDNYKAGELRTPLEKLVEPKPEAKTDESDSRISRTNLIGLPAIA
jgi:hypothetical protein